MSSSQQSHPTVVITGIGVVSPIGIGVDEFEKNLLAGKSGVAPIDRLAASALPQNVGGEVKEFTDSTAKKVYLKGQRKSIKVMCREIQLGVASASLALEHSGLDISQVDNSRMGVSFGANQMSSPPQALAEGCNACVDEADHQFHFEKWGTAGLARMEPLWLLKYLPNMPACHIGILADARGPNNSITQYEAAANLAMGEAFQIISRGTADLMVGGATGNRLHPVKAMHAKLWDDVADGPGDPAQWSRPFDLGRKGEVVGESACSFLMETEEHAKARNATIYGTILGNGAACVISRDGKGDITQSIAQAIRATLRSAGMSPGDVSSINAHGSGRKAGDVAEAQAFYEIFGSRAAEIPVTAFKSYVGNSGAGAGAVELAASLIGFKNGVIPKTLNYEQPDSDCNLNVVAGDHLPSDNKVFLTVNVTCMGQASALLIQAG